MTDIKPNIKDIMYFVVKTVDNIMVSNYTPPATWTPEC